MTNFEKCCRGVVKDLSLKTVSKLSGSNTVTMGLYCFAKGEQRTRYALQGRACSMFLRREKESLNRNHAAIILIKQGYGKKYNKRYYDWLFNESPFKDCYYTKYVDKTVDNAVFVNFNQPFQLVYAATIMLRVWEYPTYAESFDILVKGGVNPAFASLLKFYVRKETGGNLVFNPTPHSSNHTFPSPDDVLKNKDRLVMWINNQVSVDKTQYSSQSALFPTSRAHYLCGQPLLRKLKGMGSNEVAKESRFAWFMKKEIAGNSFALPTKELCKRLITIEQEIIG